jgi:hypothetical protein
MFDDDPEDGWDRDDPPTILVPLLVRIVYSIEHERSAGGITDRNATRVADTLVDVRQLRRRRDLPPGHEQLLGDLEDRLVVL